MFLSCTSDTKRYTILKIFEVSFQNRSMGLQVNAILAVPDHINIFSDSAKITNKILSFFEFKKLGFFSNYFGKEIQQ